MLMDTPSQRRMVGDIVVALEKLKRASELLGRIRKRQMTEDDKVVLQKQLQSRVDRKELTGVQASRIWERILRGLV